MCGRVESVSKNWGGFKTDTLWTNKNTPTEIT